LNHPQIKEAVVLAWVKQEQSGGTVRGNRLAGDKYLCAYVVPRSAGWLEVAELREYLAEILPDYMIPAYFVGLAQIPLTPNGKVNRRALPEPDLKDVAGGDFYTAPRDLLEQEMVEIWSGVLAVAGDRIGIDADFFQLGGHSLKASLLILRVHKNFDVNLPLLEVFKRPTVRGLADYIRGAARDKFVSIIAVEHREYYPLSPAQRRLYIIQQKEVGVTVYNMPRLIVLEEGLEVVNLEAAFIKLIGRHESLRTSFEIVGGQPVQRVAREVPFEIEYSEAVGDRQAERLVKDFVKPFDLSWAPLLRAKLIELKEGRHLLMVDLHHIVTDGISNNILERDFMSLYRREELPALRLQYRDFSEWQNRQWQAGGGVLNRQRDFWLEQFAGDIPPLNMDMLTDFARPVRRTFKGSILSFDIGLEETGRLNKIALQEGVTLYMILLAIFNVLLAKVCCQEDIVIGTGVAGRRHEDLQSIIGIFVNTLALRNYPSGGKTFKEFLKEVRDRTVAAFENQDYPFENIVEEAAARLEPGRNPLFDVAFALHNMTERLEAGPDDYSPQPQPGSNAYGFELGQSKFDMTLHALETAHGIHCYFVYSRELFRKESIDLLRDRYLLLLTGVLDHIDCRIKDLDIKTSLEKEIDEAAADVEFDF
jgi:acyl carrier protein